MKSMTRELHYMELHEVAESLRTHETTSVEVTTALLERISQLDRRLRSYALLMAEEALASAADADRQIAAGEYRGALHGIPIGVKDLFCTKGVRTSAGMPIYHDFYPTEDATAVTRLRRAGAVILGKLQMTEGAYSDHHPSVIPPKNPWNPAYWTGISSSGSAVAIAAGMCYGSLASDTGGSIRWPSAATGVTGIKPTWGRVSRFGTFPLAPSLDHVGVMARSATDATILLGAISGRDPKDTTTLLDPVPDYLSSKDAVGLRIGVDDRWNYQDVDNCVHDVLQSVTEIFSELGAVLVDVTLPELEQTIADWSPLCAVEAALAHESTYPACKAEYGPVLASVLDAGRAMKATEFHRILCRRMELRGRFAEVLTGIDVLLTPVQPFAPLSLNTMRSLGEQPELILKLQRFTAPFDMTGDPTITLPGGFSKEGLPIGFQLVAGHLQELQILRAARAFQNVTTWHRSHPQLQASTASAHQD